MQHIIKRLITGIILSALFLIVFFYLPPYVLSLFLVGILLEILIVEWPQLFDIRSWQFWLLMPIYPIWPFILLILMNQDPFYRPLLLLLIILVAIHDTGSYVLGIMFGSHKIAPHISPAKTWEGFIGGYSVTLLVTLGLRWHWSSPLSFSFTIIFTLLVCIVAFLGDLFESLLKRHAHIKDSGDFLPGHGGLLDRFDGILFVAYFFYLFKDWLVRIFSLQ